LARLHIQATTLNQVQLSCIEGSFGINGISLIKVGCLSKECGAIGCSCVLDEPKPLDCCEDAMRDPVETPWKLWRQLTKWGKVVLIDPLTPNTWNWQRLDVWILSTKGHPC